MVLTNTNVNMGKKKTTQGRKKIEIKKIEQETNRQVTFSKRRGGLFKKASEICVLTGAEVAIMVHSPGGRVFAFGHPSVDKVIDRYLDKGVSSSNNNPLPLPCPPPMNEFNRHYSEISKELEKEKKKKEIIEESIMVNKNGVDDDMWWAKSVEGLGLEELEEFVASLQELRKKALVRADELKMIRSSSLSLSSGGFVDLNQNPNQVVCSWNYETNSYQLGGRN